MESVRISRALLAAAACGLVISAVFLAPVTGQEDRNALTFTKTTSEADSADWKKKSIRTGPSTAVAKSATPEAPPAAVSESAPPASALAAVSLSPPHLSHTEISDKIAVAPVGLIPDKKVETNYDSLREELKTLRPMKPDEDTEAVRVPTPIPPSEKASPLAATSETAAQVNDSVAQHRPASPPKSADPEAAIGSPSARTTSLSEPGNQTQSAPRRGSFKWLRRSDDEDPKIGDPGSPEHGNPSSQVIAQYPPERMADQSAGQGGDAHSAVVSPVSASPEPKKRGLFSRLFGKNPAEPHVADTGEDSSSDGFGETTLERFPKLEEIKVKASKAELGIDGTIQQIQTEYEGRIERMTATDLIMPTKTAGAIVPRDLESAWFDAMQDNLWKNEERIAVPLRETYARALMNSNQVSVVSYIPLIGETGIGEAEGQFDPEFFAAGRRTTTDRPTNSELDTGTIGRFIENGIDAEAGIRKRFSSTGGQIALSNRFASLKNNSEFTFPNPQTSSDIVLSVRQPLLRGAGYHYNKAMLKIAKLEANSAAGEYIRLLESHLLEVNRAYWGVYLARAAYLLRQSLVEQTSAIVERIETRADEATASELLRARSELSKRRTALTRAEMAVRNAEERLRSLINDPEFPIGGSGEFIPVTRPVLEPPTENVQGAAREAVDNRTEIAQSFNQLRSTAIIQEAGRSELRPQLDLLGEVSYAGIGEDRRVGAAYDDMFEHGTGWMAGLEFSQPWERNFAKARQQRRTYEFLQQADTVRQTIATVLLESVVTFREVMTSYRDMQGRYQEVVLTREEVKALNERLEVDVDNKQTIAFQLQLIMDAIERNQIAEEQFLVSIVSYNIAFAALDQAKGTFLTYHDVALERLPDPASGKGLETIKASSPYSPASPDQSRTK